MARSNLETVREALTVQPLERRDERGNVAFVLRGVTGVDVDGSWITTTPNRSLTGYVRIPRRSQGYWVHVARWTLEHRAEIAQRQAEREATAVRRVMD